MDKIIDDIKYHVTNAGIVEKLIYINLALYFLTLMTAVFSKWFNIHDNIIIEWFSLNSNIDVFLYKPWTIISYGFIHAGFIHILFNLISLFYIGHLFLEYFTPKQFLYFYIMGSLFGGILFLTSYNFIPFFKNETVPLMGASAGVLAIFAGIATYLPNYQLKIRFIGYVPLWKVALVFIVLDLIQLSGNNAGGHFAHLGGALFGFLYVNGIGNKEINILEPFNNLFKKKEKNPLKTVYNSGQKMPKSGSFKTNNQKRTDLILDKISKSGYDTLTKEEKEFLFKQGKK